MQTSFRDSMHVWHVQGMYVVTPSGRLLAGGNRPWDTSFVIDCMRQGLRAYEAMPRSERLLDRMPDPNRDRMVAGQTLPRPPTDGLALRIVGRGLDESIVDDLPWRESQLAPGYYLLDRLWLTRDEAKQFLPERLVRGESKKIEHTMLVGIAMLNLIARGSHWDPQDVKEVKLTSHVIETSGRSVKVQLSGHAVFDANNRFNQNKYRPDLLGFATFDTMHQRFTEFALVAYGLHTEGSVDSDTGTPKYIPFGFLLELNGTNSNDNVIPSKLPLYRYARLQCGQ